MRLGREFNQLDVFGLLSSLSVLEFDQWFEHFAEQLFTNKLLEFFGGQLCAATYNSTGTFKPISPQEFYPNYKKPDQSLEEQAAIWRLMAGA